MTIVQINTCADGSTGTIMLQTAEEARKAGHMVYTFSRKWRHQPPAPDGHTYFGSFFENALHQILANRFGYAEMFSYFGTQALIRKLKKISPDVIHLHNLHGWYIHLPLLFRYIKQNNIRVVWTLHDCWSFTGHCPHFMMSDCDKWKTGCYDCPQHRQYPASDVDRSETMWRRKKEWFTGVSDLIIVTPSEWLANLVKQSFLREYPVKVVQNGIDLSVFKPVKSNFRKIHSSKKQFIILGVAATWGKRKGLDVFVRLSELLDERFQIVLVGTNDKIDKKLPNNVLSIHQTANAAELAEIYSAADLFVNPTREEVQGLVNLEALACGTPVLTFATGGSPECIDETCGKAVLTNDIDTLYHEIITVFTNKPYSDVNCQNRAKLFDKNVKFKEYVDLYEDRAHRSERPI